MNYSENNTTNIPIFLPYLLNNYNRFVYKYKSPFLSNYTEASFYNYNNVNENIVNNDPIDQEFDIVIIDRNNIYDPSIPVDDYILFIIKISHIMHYAGATIHILENDLIRLTEKIGLECSIVSMPSMLLITFGEKCDVNKVNSNDEMISSLYNRKIHLYIGNQMLDGDKLYLCDQLVHNMLNDKIPFRSAACLLNSIEEKPMIFPMWLLILSTAVSSSTIVSVFFGGNWNDFILCFILGIILGAFCYISDRSPILFRFQLILSGFICAFLSGLSKVYITSDLCLGTDVISSLCWLLPGFSFTLALVELSNGKSTFGASRLFFDLLICAQLGFGATLVFQLSSYFSMGHFIDASNITKDCDLFLEPFTWVFFFPMAISWFILLNSSFKQLPIMLISITLGMINYAYLFEPVGENLANTVSAFSMGLICNIYSRFTKEPVSVVMVYSIFLLVPGNLGIQVISAFLGNEFEIASTFLYGFLYSCFSITVGLSTANLVVFPTENEKVTY